MPLYLRLLEARASGSSRMTVSTTRPRRAARGRWLPSGQIFYFGKESKFYLSVASNLITGQSVGQAVQFTIYSHKNGTQPIQVARTTNTTYAVEYSGCMILAVRPDEHERLLPGRRQRRFLPPDGHDRLGNLVPGAVAVNGSVFNTPLSALGSPVTIYGIVAAPTIGGQAVNGSASAASLTVAPSVSAGQLVAVVIHLARGMRR